MFNIGFEELILILLVAFVIVGPKDLPRVARALGRWVRYLRQMFQEFQAELGLEETIQDLKGTEADLKKTLRSADPTSDLRAVKRDTEKTMRETKKAIQSDPKEITK